MSETSVTHGLWAASAPPAPHTSALCGDIDADVVVVGAGYTGLSAALHLAQGGASVVVLEADHVGYGGSGRNVGLVNAGMWVMPDALPDALGEQYGKRLLTLLGEAPSLVYALVEQYDMDCQATRKGTLHCAVGRKGWQEIRDRYRQWQALDAPVALLDAESIAQATGTRAYLGGLMDHRAGTIQPLAYARGLAHAAMRSGIGLYTNSRVLRALDQGGSWRLETAQGSVRASWVIVATNAYSRNIWPQVQAQLVRLPYFNLATRPLPEPVRRQILPGLQGVWDTCQVLSSYRWDCDGRLIFGSVGALRGCGAKIHKGWGRRALASLFPMLGQVEFEYEWYGHIGMTDNALPRFHWLDRNTITFCGYNGRGIAPGTAFGRELARLVLGQTTAEMLPLPVTVPRNASFKQARECGYELGSEIVHLLQARC